MTHPGSSSGSYPREEPRNFPPGTRVIVTNVQVLDGVRGTVVQLCVPRGTVAVRLDHGTVAVKYDVIVVRWCRLELCSEDMEGGGSEGGGKNIAPIHHVPG